MKKLMMFAAAMTIVGGAFAAPVVYDYKASVKNVNLKKVSIKIDGDYETVYVKYVQTSSLYGYLIENCGLCNQQASNGAGVLVVATKATKKPVIMAADMDVKVWNPKINASKTWEAEGYLYTWGMADSSAKLFGTYNDAQVSYQDDDMNPTTPDVKVTQFEDTWLDAAGFGKAKSTTEDGGCDDATTCAVLDSLAGSVIGGLFICHENGFDGWELVSNSLLCPTTWFYNTTDVISGTWNIKRNTKFTTVESNSVALDDTATPPTGNSLAPDGELDDYVAGALSKMKATQKYADVVSTDFAVDFKAFYGNP